MKIQLVVAMVMGIAGSATWAADDVQSQLEGMKAQMQAQQAQMEAQSAEINRLRAAAGETWLNERRAEEIKTLVREVLSDAETRASLLDSSLTAGHNGKNFFLASEDGNFEMIIKGQLQARYTVNFRDGLPGDGTDEDGNGDSDEGEGGFMVRRAKVEFAGHVINPRVHYALRLSVNRSDNQVIADKIVIGYDLTDTLYLWAGEDKGPFLREELVSSTAQLAVERSLVNEVFTLDKVQGVGLNWDAHDQVKVMTMIHDGTRSGDGSGGSWVSFLTDTDEFDDEFSDHDKSFDDDYTDFAIAARGDLLLAGSWDQWKDFTSWSDEELFAYIGAAIDYEDGETGDKNDNRLNWEYLSWTIDAGVEYQGWSLFAAYVGANVSTDDFSGAGDDFTPWGVVVQGSYNMAMNNGTAIEPFVRYEHLDLDDYDGALDAGLDNEIDLLTIGANWYHAKHSAKLTADVVIALDALHRDVPQVNDGLGLLHDAPGEDGQVALRLQYQLLF